MRRSPARRDVAVAVAVVAAAVSGRKVAKARSPRPPTRSRRRPIRTRRAQLQLRPTVKDKAKLARGASPDADAVAGVDGAIATKARASHRLLVKAALMKKVLRVKPSQPKSAAR